MVFVKFPMRGSNYRARCTRRYRESVTSLAAPAVAAVDHRLRTPFGQHGYGGSERGRGRGECEGHRKTFAGTLRVPAVALPCLVPSQLEEFARNHARDGGDDSLGQFVGGGIRILQSLLAQLGDLAIDAVQGFNRAVSRRFGCGVGFVAHTHQSTAGRLRASHRSAAYTAYTAMRFRLAGNGVPMGRRRVRGKV